MNEKLDGGSVSVSIDSYILLLVRSRNFPALKEQMDENIRYFRPLAKHVYEVLALDSIDLATVQENAEVEFPYNPASPDHEMIRVHGRTRAVELARKRFLDRWTFKPSPRVFAVYMHCMASAFPEDYCWIMRYFLQRTFTVDHVNSPVMPSDFQILGIRSSLDQSHFRAALSDHGLSSDDILSCVLMDGGSARGAIYELWVAKSATHTLEDRFQVMQGFDPLLSAGVFDTAAAQDRLLTRMRRTSYVAQQLYLYYLRMHWPETFAWAIEEFGPDESELPHALSGLRTSGKNR